jgi:hypothetical protein
MGQNGHMRVPFGAAFAALMLAMLVTTGAQAQTVTIRLTSLLTVRQDHDRAPKGKASKGDSIDFKDLLLNRKPQFGKKAGVAVAYDVGTMTYTSKTTTRITVKATFPKIGTITYAGPFVTKKDGTTVIPITGGTGGFKGATGTVIIGSGETKSPNTYVVTVPHPLDIKSTGVA